MSVPHIHSNEDKKELTVWQDPLGNITIYKFCPMDEHLDDEGKKCEKNEMGFVSHELAID